MSSEPRETSTATTGLLLRHVAQQAGPEAVAEVLRRAEVPHTAAELDEPSRWVSYDTRLRLFEAAVAVLDDPDAMFAVGASGLRHEGSHSVVLLARLLGSPQQVYRSLPRTLSRFSTVSTMEVVESGPTHATLTLRLHDGYRHSRLDCRYAQGLVSTIPEIFGRPRAEVVHEECQSDGFAACTYHVTWQRRGRRLRRDGRAVERELTALREQLHELQSASADLAGSADLTDALERITARAAAAVMAPSHVLAVRAPDGGPPLVHSAGLDPTPAAQAAEVLLAGGDLGPNAVVVEVATARRHHGYLAALHPEGVRGMIEERRLLAAYAGHAAAALDLLIAVEDSRRGERRARSLLDLANALADAVDDHTVATTVVGALPGIVGSTKAALLRWDSSRGELVTLAAAGLSDDQETLLRRTPVRADVTPELVEMLTRHEPTVIATDTASPELGALLVALAASDLVAVPLLADDTLLGVVTAGWGPGDRPSASADEVLARLRGVADQAASALQNARLLATVRHQSQHDALTGLPNRVLFVEELEAALRRTARVGTGCVAVVFCDVDRFKRVNDVFGHAAGDELLRQVAARLRGSVRPQDVVSRLSGDEFALVFPDVPDAGATEQLAGRVLDSFAEPFRIEGRELRVTTSVGVAASSGTGGDGDRLLRAADAAMYEAKQRGRGQLVTADALQRVPAAEGSFQAELDAVLSGDQLVLHFQPIVDVSVAGRGDVSVAGRGDVSVAGQVVGAEALVRWQHPRLGLLPPAAFVPLAEERGSVIDLDLWVLRAACLAAVGWPPVDGRRLHLSVNVSTATLLDRRLLPAVRAALAQAELEPSYLTLEVVESRSLVDLPGVTERLAELRRLGVRVALDDFGTGFSTLTWLQRLPIDQIKIDRTFVAGLPTDGASLGLVRGVLALARELGLEVVAEGIEDPAQLAAVREAGCRYVQGYLLGRPSADVPGRTGAPALAPREV